MIDRVARVEQLGNAVRWREEWRARRAGRTMTRLRVEEFKPRLHGTGRRRATRSRLRRPLIAWDGPAGRRHDVAGVAFCFR
jgi:hypothetical protein